MLDVLTDLLAVGHMAAFALGLGAAVFLEITVLQKFRTRIALDDLVFLYRGHVIIGAAVRALWITGLLLLIVKTGFGAAPFTAKMAMKLGVVALLTANMVLIERFVLSRLLDMEEKSLADIPTRERAMMGGIGGLSMACWLSALALGGIGYLQSLGVVALLGLFGSILLIGAATGGVLGLRFGQERAAGTGAIAET